MKFNEFPQKRAGWKPAGFTLIELLIVVAIIAVLAAIAVPNYLEAQTRARVSRAHSDMRTLATALESYHISHNNYPPMRGTLDDPANMAALSTPISFISDPLMIDPFRNPHDLSIHGLAEANQYGYLSFKGEPFGVRARFESPDAFPRVGAIDMQNGGFPGPYGWILVSYGPDILLQFDDDPNIPNNLKSIYLPYDPTNGTVSRGDVARLGPGAGGV